MRSWVDYYIRDDVVVRALPRDRTAACAARREGMSDEAWLLAAVGAIREDARRIARELRAARFRVVRRSAWWYRAFFRFLPPPPPPGEAEEEGDGG